MNTQKQKEWKREREPYFHILKEKTKTAMKEHINDGLLLESS